MTAETLGAVLARVCKDRGDVIALVFGTRETSFAALDRDSTAAARRLIAAGLRPGDRIGYLGQNSDRFFELLFAAAKAGLVMVPLGWRLTRSELSFLLEDSRIAWLFVEPDFVETASSIGSDTPLHIVSVEGAYEVWRAQGVDRAIALPSVRAEEPVIQLYTSGTTGRPKGAMLSHANLFALRPLSVAAGLDWDRWNSGDVSLVTMPIAHVSGSVWGLIGLYNGIKSIILRVFDAGAVLRAVSSEPISKIFLVPAAIQAVLRHPDLSQADLSRLRYILYGASPMPLALLKEAVAAFGCRFVQNYGMTETCGTIVALPPEDHDVAGGDRMTSAGRAMPGVDLRIVDADLVPVESGVTGEILVRSPTTMMGYWNRAEATAEVLIDGWMRTGDAGYLDADGYLFIKDRLKDMIISGGENVYPAEIENMLYAHPAIADVAVIGVPDARWGEAVLAVGVRAPGDETDESDILGWARTRLAGYKVPKSIIWRDGLPRNASGKILRKDLRAPFWEGLDRGVN